VKDVEPWGGEGGIVGPFSYDQMAVIYSANYQENICNKGLIRDRFLI
jgi:hypothetical protein